MNFACGLWIAQRYRRAYFPHKEKFGKTATLKLRALLVLTNEIAALSLQELWTPTLVAIPIKAMVINSCWRLRAAVMGAQSSQNERAVAPFARVTAFLVFETSDFRASIAAASNFSLCRITNQLGAPWTRRSRLTVVQD